MKKRPVSLRCRSVFFKFVQLSSCTSKASLCVKLWGYGWQCHGAGRRMGISGPHIKGALRFKGGAGGEFTMLR